jgi:hypothetical protein
MWIGTMKRASSTVGLGLTVLTLIGLLVLTYFVVPRLWADSAPMALKLTISGSLFVIGCLLSYLALLFLGERYGGKRVMFTTVFGGILTVATLAGIEFLSSFYAPAWPARALRSVPPANPVAATNEPFAEKPWLANPFNSWGMRDVERTIAKPAGGVPRVVFVGDSFVESGLTPMSLPAAVERQAAASGDKIEAINLGVSGTNPRSYYYRTRDVALKLSPDALLLFIYAGNDFIPGGYSMWPSLIDESEGGSLLGSVMPRTNWLLVNRLRLSEFLSGTPAPDGEAEMLHEDLRAPPGERADRLAAHVKKYYYPDLPEEKIREILARGDGRLWRIAEPHEGEQDELMGWMLGGLMSWEARNFDIAKSREDAPRKAFESELRGTLSWIEATDRIAREHKVPLVVFLVPVGGGDPAYAEFWKPWPRAYSWNYVCDEWQTRLVAALSKTQVRFVDLRADLNGVPDTYRKLDGHWSQKGEAIVAGRVEEELERLLGPEKVLDSKR